MKKRRSFTAEQKAKIVLEMVSGERTVLQIAAEYEVNPNYGNSRYMPSSQSEQKEL